VQYACFVSSCGSTVIAICDCGTKHDFDRSRVDIYGKINPRSGTHCNTCGSAFIKIQGYGEYSAGESARIQGLFAKPAPTAPPKACCPRCHSEQIGPTTERKSFSFGKAAAGGVLVGGLGLLAGFAGSNKNKVMCMACGHTWKP
jgi:hypothetical protein